MRAHAVISAPNLRAARAGFTLIELIVVMILLSVMLGMTASLTPKPLQAYSDVRLRTILTDSAEAATQRMGRDLRAALPNSTRISVDGRKLELLHVLDGARYREPGLARIPTTVDHTARHGLARLHRSRRTASTSWVAFTELGLAYGVGSPAGYRLAIYPDGGHHLRRCGCRLRILE